MHKPNPVAASNGVFVILSAMKRIVRLLLILLVLAAAVGGWAFLAPATGFSTDKKFLYIRTDAATRQAVLDSIAANNVVKSRWAFDFLAARLKYWSAVKPGRYEIKKGASLMSIVRMLRNGRQAPVDLVITKLRTKEDFARLTGNRFEFDSVQMISFLNDAESLDKLGVDTASVLRNVLPDTYRFTWNTAPATVYERFCKESQKFWTADRLRGATAIGLKPGEVHVLASIIEEETTNNNEKDTIASVYLNRLKTGMPLQADPTLKFAVRNFALKRIAGDILKTPSPYNTYRNKGLPPGPICTPSKLTIDKVLNPADTRYLYFVANPRLSGHLFSETFAEHVQKAAQYRLQDKQRRTRDSALQTL